MPFLSNIKSSTTLRSIQQELQPQRLVFSITAGLICGVLLVIYAISMAVLIFAGDFAPFVSVGIGLSLFTGMTVSIVVALTSSLPGMMIMPQDTPAVILSLMVSAIAAQFSDSTTETERLSTVLWAIALTSLLTGVACFLLGRFRLGNLTRFMPYPVVGGFLAGIGYLLSQGALNLMTDRFFQLAELTSWLQPAMLIRWLPGLVLAIVLLLLLRRFSHPFLLPAIILGSILLFYVMLGLTQTSIAAARSSHLLLEAFPAGPLWQPLSLSTLTQANWGLIGQQTSKIFTTVLLSVVSLLLIATGIELTTKQEINLNQELQVAGVANIVTGLGGGIIGFHALGLSTFSYVKLGAKSRLVGILAATVCLITLVFGETLVSLFPKPVLGGVILYLGLSFLMEWLYDAWFKLPKVDYALIVLILTVIATLGFLPGVAVGLVAAIALFVYKYSQVNATRYTLSGAVFHSHMARSLPQERLLRKEGDQITILDLQGYLFFGTANSLLQQVRQRLQTEPPLKFVVFNFRAVTGLDSSAVLSFIKLKQMADKHSFQVIFTQLLPRIQHKLQRGGCLQANDQIYHLFPDLDRGIEWCENQILAAIPWRRGRSLPLALQLDDLFPNAPQLSNLMDYLEEIEVEVGDYLFEQGQPSDALYLIESGQVTLSFVSEVGQSHRLQTLKGGSLVGEMDFFLQLPHKTTAVVEAPSIIYQLSDHTLTQMQQEAPEVAIAFQSAVNHLLSERLSDAYQEMQQLLF